MADNQVTLELSVDSKDAQKAIEQFGASSIKSVKSVEGSFKGLASSFSSLLAPLASIGVAMKAISEANEAEKSMRSLSIAIASTGEYSKSSLKAMQDFSNELSDLTGIDDDVINSQLAVAKSFGITNEQAKSLVKAATNLSAVTGTDLDSAVKQLGGTFDGTVGKIGNLGGGFRALTKEQLENGAAIELINKNYKDAGKVLGDTFEGDLNRVKNAFNDSFKAIGTEILNDPNLRAGLKGLSEAIKSAAPIAVSTSKIIINAFKILGTGISTVVGSISGVLSQLSSLVGADGISKSLEEFSLASFDVVLSLNQQTEATVDAADSSKRFENQMNSISNAYDKNSKNAEKNAKIISDLKKQYEEVVKSIQNAGLAEIETAGKLAGERFATIDKAVKYGVVKESEASIQRLKVIDEFNKAYEKSAKEAAEKSAEAYRGSFDSLKTSTKELQKALDETGKSYTEMVDLEFERSKLAAENAKKELELLGKSTEESNAQIQLFLKLAKAKANLAKTDFAKFNVNELFETAGEKFKSIFNGAEVSQSILNLFSIGAELLSRAAQSIRPAIEEGVKFISGQRFQELFDISASIGNLPNTINNLFKNFGETFSKILDELPAAIEKLINELPKLAESLAQKIGTILETVFNKLPEIVTSLLKAFGSLIQTLFQKAIPALIDALPGVVAAIADALPGLFETILKALPNIITKIFEAIPKIIRSIVDAIPAIIEVFAENIGPIVEALVEGIVGAAGEIVAGLIDSLLVKGGLERIVGALIRAMPRIAVALVVGIAKGLGTAGLAIGHAIGGGFLAVAENFKNTFAGTFDGIKAYFQGFGDSIANIFNGIGPAIANGIRESIANIGGPFGEALRRVTEPLLQGLNGLKSTFQPLIDAINAVKEAFEKASGTFGKGGGSGIIAETGDKIASVFGFSKGGIVPKYAATGMVARGTDTIPAMVTPGEMVTPVDTVGQLQNFLDNNGKSDAILMAILQAVQQPVTVQSEVKVNQSAFADIMLQLSRQNARTAA